MNRGESEKFRDRQICHKYNLIHLLPTLNKPELSGLYLKSFLNATKRYQIKLPSLIEEPDSKFCGSCGCVRIPHYNTQLSTVEAQEGEISTRKLRYRCLHCQHEAQFQLEVSTINKVVEQKPLDEKFTATWPRQDKATDKVEKKNSSKSRAKKRKMNSLSNLLSKKNEEKEKRNLSSLSLESFMRK